MLVKKGGGEGRVPFPPPRNPIRDFFPLSSSAVHPRGRSLTTETTHPLAAREATATNRAERGGGNFCPLTSVSPLESSCSVLFLRLGKHSLSSPSPAHSGEAQFLIFGQTRRGGRSKTFAKLLGDQTEGKKVLSISWRKTLLHKFYFLLPPPQRPAFFRKKLRLYSISGWGNVRLKHRSKRGGKPSPRGMRAHCDPPHLRWEE